MADTDETVHHDRLPADGRLCRIRDLIAETYPDDFNDRMWTPGGFYRRNSERERISKMKSGKAEFMMLAVMSGAGFGDAPGRYRLISMRFNDQFNTTVYGFSDRLRGIEGTRDVQLINPADRLGRVVSLVSDAECRVGREVSGMVVTPFPLPDGCLAAYYPEMNPLIPLWHHDKASKTPASKSVVVRIKPTEERRPRTAQKEPTSHAAQPKHGLGPMGEQAEP